MAKTNSPNLKTVTSKIPPKLVTELDEFAAIRSCTRSQAIREFVEWGLREKSLVGDLRSEMDLVREENRQLTALLIANLSDEEVVARASIPTMIEETINFARSRLSD